MQGQGGANIPRELQSFIERMPKSELHIHLEGSFEAKLAFAIAKRNGIELGCEQFPWTTVEQLESAYQFEDLKSFLDVYNKVAGVLKTEEDFFELAQAYCQKARSENVRHAEIFFDPQTHTSRGIAFKIVADGIFRALQAAAQEGLSTHLIASFLRDHPVGTRQDSAPLDSGFSGVPEATCWATVKQTVEYNKQAAPNSRIIGVGLDNNEIGFPPKLFTDIYSFAREDGLLATAHAGEEGPPEYVWEAINDLQCARIDHGVHSMKDPNLVSFLATPGITESIISAYHGLHRIPVTICPLSNYKLKVFPDPAETNIVEMLDAGLLVTVNCDDPAYVGGYATENYLFLLKYLTPPFAKARPIDLADVYRLCVNGFEGSWLDTNQKIDFLNEVNKYFSVDPGLLYKDLHPTDR